jgi:hypothetical protein
MHRVLAVPDPANGWDAAAFAQLRSDNIDVAVRLAESIGRGQQRPTTRPPDAPLPHHRRDQTVPTGSAHTRMLCIALAEALNAAQGTGNADAYIKAVQLLQEAQQRECEAAVAARREAGIRAFRQFNAHLEHDEATAEAACASAWRACEGDAEWLHAVDAYLGIPVPASAAVGWESVPWGEVCGLAVDGAACEESSAHPQKSPRRAERVA